MVGLSLGMSDMISINFDRPMPVFPLSQCVLLPGAILPLHVFEDRYREMTRDILDSTGLIAMAMFDEEPSEEAYEKGRPELRPSVCVGYSVEHECLEDGRYLLVLKGVCRAKLVDEVTDEYENKGYRQFLIEPTDIPQADGDKMQDERIQIANLLSDRHISRLEGVDHLRCLVGTELPTSVLIDVTISTICEHVEERYQMLALNDPTARGMWLIRRLKQIQDRLAAGGDGYARLN